MYKVLKCSRSQTEEKKKELLTQKHLNSVGDFIKDVLSHECCWKLMKQWINKNLMFWTKCLFVNHAHKVILKKKQLSWVEAAEDKVEVWMNKTSFSENVRHMWNYLRKTWKRNEICTLSWYWLVSDSRVRTLSRQTAEHKSCRHANNKGQHGPNWWTVRGNKVRLYYIATSVKGTTNLSLKREGDLWRKADSIITFLISVLILRLKVPANCTTKIRKPESLQKFSFLQWF